MRRSAFLFTATVDACGSASCTLLEIFAGSGQFIAYGWHQKAGRPYRWPNASPRDLNADGAEIPAITRAQLDCFTSELFKRVPRRLLPTQHHSGCAAGVQTISERLRLLTRRHGSSGGMPRASCFPRRRKAAGMKPPGRWSLQPLGAAFPRMLFGNYLKSTFRDGKDFPSPTLPPQSSARAECTSRPP